MGVADGLREDGCYVCPKKDVSKLPRFLSPMLTSKLYRSQASASPAKPPVAAAPKAKAGNSGKSKAKAKAKPKGKAPHGGGQPPRIVNLHARALSICVWAGRGSVPGSVALAAMRVSVSRG
jgi:hypothetical protein